MSTGRYELTIVKIDGTSLDEITASAFDGNGDVRRMRAHASLDPIVTFYSGQSPVFRFSTLKVGTALAAVGIDGLDVSSGVELGYVERDQGGGYVAGGEKVSATKCLVVPDSLTVSQDGDAELSYIGYCYSSDGTTAPLAHASSLPSGTPGVTEVFTLGTVTTGDVPAALGQVLGWRLSFGIGVQVKKADGALYPTKAYLTGGRSPVLEVTVADLGELSTARLVGSEVDNVVLNLIKRSITGGGFAGAGDATLTMDKAYLSIASAGGSFPGDTSASLRILPRKEGANALIAVA